MSISGDFVAQSLPKRRLLEVIWTLFWGPARKVKKCVSITPACVDCMWALPGKALDRLKNCGKRGSAKRRSGNVLFRRFSGFRLQNGVPKGDLVSCGSALGAPGGLFYVLGAFLRGFGESWVSISSSFSLESEARRTARSGLNKSCRCTHRCYTVSYTHLTLPTKA